MPSRIEEAGMASDRSDYLPRFSHTINSGVLISLGCLYIPSGLLFGTVSLAAEVHCTHFDLLDFAVDRRRQSGHLVTINSKIVEETSHYGEC